MIKKLIFAAVAIAGISLHSHGATMLRVELADGTKPTFLLSDTPKATFSGDIMTIATPEISVSYPRADVVKMDFTTTDAGINGIRDLDTPCFSYIDGTVKCEGSEITIYNISGSLIASGYGEFNTAGLTPGCYIVVTKTNSVKIVIK